MSTTDLNLPFAGRRDYTTYKVSNRGSEGYYRSSVPYDWKTSWYVDFYSSYIYWQKNNYGKRSYGYSVRCFRNPITNTVMFNAQ
jgi:hypothetical protein